MQIPIMNELFGDLSVTQFLITAFIALAVIYYLYATRHHGVWEKLGVPGPKPWPIIDHKLELKRGVDAAIRKWFKMYGNTFGAYGLIPHRAVLITKDVSLIKQILITDFDNFIERARPRKTASSLRNAMSSVTGDTWRRNRHVTSRMFSGVRVKLMFKHVCDSSETLTQLIKQTSDKGQLIPIKLFASKFATEVIARIAFGVETHAVSEQETEFAYYSRKLVNIDTKFHSVVDNIYQYFPQIGQVLRFLNINFDFIDKHADKYFVSIVESSMQNRKKRNQSGDRITDIVDMLVKASVDNSDPRLQDIDSRTLSHDEIAGNSIMLILAGVETVSTTFQSLLYCLSLHEDIQEKVVAEIDLVFPKGTHVDYDQLKELKYTEQVINETLRLFPVVSIILRIAAETRCYRNITIPKGTYVHISLGEAMKDPEHWLDPEKFDPDRFSPENKDGRDPLAFAPFGYGPRICPGIRLAMAELKTVLVYLLRDLRFTLSERTEPKKGETLVMKNCDHILERPINPIQLEAVSRK